MALMALHNFVDNPSLYNLPLDSSVVSEHEKIEAILNPFLVECYTLEVGH